MYKHRSTNSARCVPYSTRMDQHEFEIRSDLGLGGQAAALLALLSYDPLTVDLPHGESPPEVDNFAWYNGDERGVLLDVKLPNNTAGDHLYIVWGEEYGSDSLFVDCWIAEPVGVNPPTVYDMPAEAHNRRCLFKYGDLREASSYVLDLIQDFAEGVWACLSWKCPACRLEGVSYTDLNEDGTLCPKCSSGVEGTRTVRVPMAADPRTWD